MAEGVETSLNEMPSENLPRGEHTINVSNGLRLDKVPYAWTTVVTTIVTNLSLSH